MRRCRNAPGSPWTALAALWLWFAFTACAAVPEQEFIGPFPSWAEVKRDYGAWYSKLGRLTFDGQGKARTAIAHGKSFATYNEFFDVFIRDVGIGNSDPALMARSNRPAFTDQVVSFDALKESAPELPGVPPSLHRPVIEVPAGVDNRNHPAGPGQYGRTSRPEAGRATPDLTRNEVRKALAEQQAKEKGPR